jgi:hypothetical protein
MCPLLFFPVMMMPTPSWVTLPSWSYDPVSYASGSVATGRMSHARQVKGDDPDTMGYPAPPDCGIGHGVATLPHKRP